MLCVFRDMRSCTSMCSPCMLNSFTVKYVLKYLLTLALQETWLRKQRRKEQRKGKKKGRKPCIFHYSFTSWAANIECIRVCLCVYIDVDKCIWLDILKTCVQTELLSSLYVKENQEYVLEKKSCVWYFIWHHQKRCFPSRSETVCSSLQQFSLE